MQSIKRRLSPRLLAIDGVTAVGLAGGSLVVYVTDDAAAIRRAIAELFEAEVGVPWRIAVSGALKLR